MHSNQHDDEFDLSDGGEANGDSYAGETLPSDEVQAVESPAVEPGPAVEAESLGKIPAAEAATDVETAETVEAAGIVDELLGGGAILLPFILDPAKINGVLEGIDQIRNATTLTGQWQGFKRVGDMTIPLVEKFVDRVKLSRQPRTAVMSVPVAFLEQSREAVSICQMRTFAEAETFVEAKRLGSGQLLKRLRDGLGEFAQSPFGQALLKMALERLMAGLVPVG